MRPVLLTRGGFTMAEMMVSVAVATIAAAAFLPAVIGQTTKGEVTAIATDLKMIASSVRQFNIDVQRWPKSLEDLVERPSPMRDVNNNLVPDALAVRWEGPYFDGQLDGNPLQTGFNALIQIPFTTRSMGGVTWLAVEIEDISQPEVEAVSKALDDHEVITDDTAGGTIRWDGDKMVALLVPMGH